MDYATLHILAMGGFGIAFICYVNWLEHRERQKQKDIPKESP